MLTSRYGWHPIDGPEDYRLHRNICYGGDGGGAPEPPDYSDYIAAMTETGNELTGHGRALFDWAKQQGLDLTNLGQMVSKAAGTAAGSQQARSDRMMDRWSTDYDPLYGYQREDAARMQRDLPATEEAYAGAFGADVGRAIDQALATEQRKQAALDISPGIASEALDTQARIGRAMATSAAGQQGRQQARTEARNVTNNAIQTGQFIPGVAGQQAGLATANRGQQAAVPATMASTSAGLYNPSIGYYNAALPYMKTWGDTLGRSYDQSLAAWKANQENDDGGVLGTILPLAGGIAGSFFGPMGSMVGSSLGKMAGSAMSGGGGYTGGPFGSSGGSIFGGLKKGGKIPANGGRRIPRYAAGGAIDTGPPMNEGNYVPPEASPSGGEQVDDVHAMVSAGEFVIPERTVDWYGEKFFQNLISKADAEAQQETVAAPEEQEVGGQQMAAMDTMPPMFRSEGARV